ncbi:MAG: hypothetical protein JWQ40_1668 [Segetibacter sp.]|nr:hypothetical protein [Segetibacter sp.]
MKFLSITIYQLVFCLVFALFVILKHRRQCFLIHPAWNNFLTNYPASRFPRGLTQAR